MTIDEAIAELRAKRAAMLEVTRATIDEVGEEAVRRIRKRWPIDTKLSHDGWYWNTAKTARNKAGGRIMNEVPYTEFVHHGFAFRLIPEVLAELRPVFGASLTQRLSAVGSRRAA